MKKRLRRKKRRDRKGAEETFILASAELFASSGFDATTTNEIARRAKLSESLITRYFGGKKGLFEVVRARALQTLHEVSQLEPNEGSDGDLGIFLLSCLSLWGKQTQAEKNFIGAVFLRAIFDQELGKELGAAIKSGAIELARLGIEQRLGQAKKASSSDIVACATAVVLMGFSMEYAGLVTYRESERMTRFRLEITRVLARGLAQL